MVYDDEVCDALKRIAKLEGASRRVVLGRCCAASYKVRCERLGPGKRIVPVFPDGAERYRSQGDH